jgi:hypothetical protein
VLPVLAASSIESRWTVERVPDLSCPDPKCGEARLRGHGWYKRYLGGERQAFRRVRCSRCKVSHASGCESSERRRRGLRSIRQPGCAAGARLAAQRRGAVCREGARVAGPGVRSVVAQGAGGGGPGGGLADAAAPLAVVVLALLSGWGERAFPPRPAVCSAAEGLSIGW